VRYQAALHTEVMKHPACQSQHHANLDSMNVNDNNDAGKHPLAR